MKWALKVVSIGTRTLFNVTVCNNWFFSRISPAYIRLGGSINTRGVMRITPSDKKIITPPEFMNSNMEIVCNHIFISERVSVPKAKVPILDSQLVLVSITKSNLNDLSLMEGWRQYLD